MVSEDSQHLRWFSVIHRLLDLCDLHHAFQRHVSSFTHEVDDQCELLKVFSLRSAQWVLAEERNDLRTKGPPENRRCTAANARGDCPSVY